MSATLTIRGLDLEVKQKLRVQAAMNGRAMEAEAREILARALLKTKGNPPAPVTKRKLPKSVCGTVRGIWKGRMSTDEIMKLTRGE
jgi:plasmid stability protein